ncbi:hypothetical protein GLOIN_2v1779703 [Rhizophagus irregularis DAOM 181602=DAOM 197198]|nr:hypothetical protein GLOIN_2v1779703 [Rhizophagus irregularis DAOM 181602=DAOM 197198]
MINSQKNLRKLLLGFNDFPLHYSLLSLQSPNCLNTLNTIIFYYVDFKNITVLTEVFNQLNVLESIHIIYCLSLNSRFIQQINNVTKPLRLKSLFLDEVLQIDESLELLIQKSGSYLEYFGIINYESQQLLRLIIKYCSKIKFLGPTWMDSQKVVEEFEFYSIQVLNYDDLFIDIYDFINFVKEID